ncbi:MAG: 23S rRNA (uracil(1939)-C(5))-methyltransferase RlmD [Lachnospiraceae bacterium]|nr:23S rRNA (uracil(1939)-C(5))-methyltransferase RlmD [Lachnospiraceae bacterium]
MAKDKRKKEKKVVCRKNDELLLKIEDMGTEGEGIGRADGYALFVKDALIGDLVRVRVMKTRKHFGYARLLEIVKPSPFRVEPKCPVARQCGGCQLQHCSYEKQLQWKEEKILNCLKRIGGVDVNQVIVEPIMGMASPYHYRNKSQYPVGYNRDGEPVAGFYVGRTHQIIPCRNCEVGDPSNQLILDTVLDFMKDNRIPAYVEKEHRGLVRHILIRVGKETGQIMVCLIINGKKLPKSELLVEQLRQVNPQIASICLNVNEADTNVILGEEIIPLYGEPYIEDCIGELRYRISPLSFYQVNPEQTKRLYETALEYADLQGAETVWDLYCGIGTISLFLSQKADKVYGVEIVPQAIEDAKYNAELNHITNAEFFVGAAEEVVPAKFRESGDALRADVVVLDPPRKGCEEKLLQTVIEMEPKRIVYVSCDPGTLARDLKYLRENGYELERVRGCDMFGMSYHVESVSKLSLKE